jgi:tRNA modification GTPase
MIQGSTIAAIATPPGKGAIAVIRLSGEGAFSICGQIFRPAARGMKLSEQPGNTVHYGKIFDNGNIIDEILLSIFRSPHSYTGEDLVEISCHGSVYIQQKILQIILDRGAEPAKPGEFTRRAFLNGKMDLSQAEAVADLIASESAAFHKVVMQQMRGGFSGEIKALRSRLLEFISLVELELDFSEEDVEFADRSELRALLDKIAVTLGSLTGSFALGNALKNGIPVVIAGKPNVGKSTLLNLLLKEEKALVSEIPGTTRDSIEDVIHLEGISFRFIDTAGIRETADKIEIMGIERTMEKIRQAGIILFMAEAGDTGEHINHLLESLQNKPEFEGKRIILLLNKSDLLPGHGETATEGNSAAAGKTVTSRTGPLPETSDNRTVITKHFPSLGEKDHVLNISAKTSKGLEELKRLLVSIVQQDSPGQGDVIVTNIRHYHALKNAHEAVLRASEGLENQLPGDLLAMDIREVLHYLGEITGEITTDEILGNIFRNFCIGK